MAGGQIRWGRILLGGFLTEVAIFAVYIPLNTIDTQVAFYAVPFLICGAAILFGWFVARPLQDRFVLHGALTAVTASVMYLALNVAAGTLPLVPWLFHVFNVLRPAAGAVGGALARSRHADPTRAAV
ncbi:MAG: hypothetical protein FJW14_09875 [Acidimicrobiia bacterium]|nr:hypothetical protein [Acidimicrobiia bacterium]